MVRQKYRCNKYYQQSQLYRHSIFFNIACCILQDFDYIDDEVFQTAIRRIPPSVRRNRYISDALADVRDDLDRRLRGCADNVTVEIHMDDYLYLPITLRSGYGSNKIVIRIDEWGRVRYEWVRKTWSTYFNNAVDTVKSIASTILSGIGSFFGSFFGSNKSLKGSSRQYLTYH